VILGLGLQWGMSLVIAGLFVAATRRLPALTRRWIASGSGYGVVIFLVMNYVVVPLSAAPWKRQFGVEKFIENFLAMILFGLIVALCARHFTYRNAASHRENTLVSPA